MCGAHLNLSAAGRNYMYRISVHCVCVYIMLYKYRKTGCGSRGARSALACDRERAHALLIVSLYGRDVWWRVGVVSEEDVRTYASKLTHTHMLTKPSRGDLCSAIWIAARTVHIYYICVCTYTPRRIPTYLRKCWMRAHCVRW